MDIKRPVGYWTSSDYIGTMPDGKKQRFVSDTEYQEAFDDVFKERNGEVKRFCRRHSSTWSTLPKKGVLR